MFLSSSVEKISRVVPGYVNYPTAEKSGQKRLEGIDSNLRIMKMFGDQNNVPLKLYRCIVIRSTTLSTNIEFRFVF